MMKWWWLGVVTFSLGQVTFDAGPNVLAINENIKFQLTLEGRGGGIPQFANGIAGNDFELMRNSPDQQSSMTMVNGKVSQKMIYTFYLRAKKQGKLILPPQTITMGGKSYQSPAFEFDVGAENRTLNNRRRSRDPFDDFFGRRNRRSSQQAKNAEIFAEASVPKSEFYLGEPIPYTVAIYRTPGVEISNAGSSMDLPKFDNFWSEEMETKQESKRVRRGDKVLEMITVDQRQLFASKAGRLTIPAANFQLTVALGRGFFADWQTVNRATKEVPITVKPLPQSGKPANFSGAVGRFRIKGELDKSKIAVGESVSLKVEVTGNGNFNALSDLKLKSPSNDLEVFDGGTPNVSRKNGIVKSKSWAFAMVPKREGTYDIAVPQISYFDLQSQTYQTTAPQTFSLSVEGGEQLIASGPVGAERTALLASQNLNYIKQGPLGSLNMGQSLTSPRPLLWIIGGLVLLNLAVIASRVINRQLQSNRSGSKGKYALRNFQKQLELLGKEQDHEAFHAGLATAVFSYFADKWKRAAQGLSLEDIGDYFNRKELAPELLKDLTEVVETCEQARFTPSSSASRDQLQQQAKQVLERIDEVMA